MGYSTKYLHIHLDELIKRVELLAHQALLLKVGGDHNPAGLRYQNYLVDIQGKRPMGKKKHPVQTSLV